MQADVIWQGGHYLTLITNPCCDIISLGRPVKPAADGTAGLVDTTVPTNSTVVELIEYGQGSFLSQNYFFFAIVTVLQPTR